jgi:hypothetical protein
MYTIMNKYMKRLMLFAAVCTVGFGFIFSSCEPDDEGSSSQIVLQSYGPMPVARGAELRFIGENMDKVTSIILPEDIEITKAAFTSVEPNLIKLTVPQEAVEGLVVLKTPQGDITTKTPIGFSEPISIESFTPTTIKAGSELTIKGDYLNLVGEVIFTDKVVVDSSNFVSKSRYELKLIVPAEAQTGKIAVSNAASDPIIVYSVADLVVALPSVTTIAPNPVKPGANLTITGTNLDLTTKIIFGGDKQVTSFVSKSATTLVVTVPANAITGAVTLVIPSGIEIAAGNITLVEPTAVIEDLKVSYGVDETVVISGTDLDLVKTATFTGGEATAVAITNGKINLKVTAVAKSGLITLTMANGTTITVDGFVTTKPVATLPSNATPLDELSIVSTLGSRVKTVKFGDLEAEATAIGGGFKVIVPLEAETGDVTLVMDNGETVAAGKININAFTFCAVSEFASEKTTMGDLLECSVVNGASLTNVLLNNANTQYLLVGTKLYVAVGVKVGDNKMTLVSGTTKVDYTIKVEASGIVETVLYNTPLELANWSKNFELNVNLSGAPADSYVRIRYTKTNSSPQIKVFHGHWGNVYDGTTAENAAILAASDYIDLPVSLFPYSDWGYSIILQGDGMIVSSISWVKDFSPPTAIWEGSAEVSGWSKSFTAMTWGGYDFSGLKVGQTMYVYYTANADATMRLGNGNWAALPSTIAIATESGDTSGEGNIKIASGTSSISFKLTAADITSIQTNGGFGAYGGDYFVTKVALK